MSLEAPGEHRWLRARLLSPFQLCLLQTISPIPQGFCILLSSCLNWENWKIWNQGFPPIFRKTLKGFILEWDLKPCGVSNFEVSNSLGEAGMGGKNLSLESYRHDLNSDSAHTSSVDLQPLT